jgi:hypothetical protein
VLARQHAPELHLADALLEHLERGPRVADAARVALLAAELVQRRGVVEPALGLVEILDDLLQRRLLAQDALRAIVVAPERRIGRLGVELLQLLTLADVVKDASAARSGGAPGGRAALGPCCARGG